MALITLLTDFGLSDVYVGVMKGVISTINPAIATIDLTHAVPPQNVALASFQLGNAYHHFPPETIHVVVVDPGVGSQRRAIALQTDAGIFVGPDNGIFTPVLEQAKSILAVELTQSRYWRTDTPSHTFHGRDIFAPVAAHLSTRVPLIEFGPQIEPQQLVRLVRSQPQYTPEGISGCIQAIDQFGNLITNIPASVVSSDGVVEMCGAHGLTGGDRTIPFGTTYSSVAPGQLVGLIGSHGWLEIAVNGGSAQAFLKISQAKDVGAGRIFLRTQS